MDDWQGFDETAYGWHSPDKAVAELERAYDSLVTLFGVVMPRPRIVVASKPDFVAWFASPRLLWAGDVEIGFSVESLCRGTVTVVATLVHEAAHYCNWLSRLCDCSRDQYHNDLFLARAESVGLTCDYSDRYGWATTQPGPELTARIEDLQIDPDVFRLYRRIK